MSTHIEVVELEFVEGGNTIWVHGPQGATVLRVKCSGQIKVQRGCENVCAHGDMEVTGDINICMPGRPKKSRKKLNIS